MKLILDWNCVDWDNFKLKIWFYTLNNYTRTRWYEPIEHIWDWEVEK